MIEGEGNTKRGEPFMRNIADVFLAFIVLCAGGIVGAALLGFI
jgi:hypothetical protein